MAIFERFIRLLSQNYRQQRELTWYSSQLCLSPKYLSGVVKKSAAARPDSGLRSS